MERYILELFPATYITYHEGLPLGDLGWGYGMYIACTRAPSCLRCKWYVPAYF